ncbi:MAG: glycosyltransferase [Lachnospiraceae bacterium]|nr:glycosyltransferase [Lachnospiraceae bacterium]
MMRLYVYGSEATTNNRIGKLKNKLKENRNIHLVSGGCNKKINKILDLVKIPFCDILYMGPFSHSNTRVIKLAKKLKKAVVIDYYVSYYDMNVLDRQLYTCDSREGKSALMVDREAACLADTLVFLNQAESRYYLSVTECSQYAQKARIIPLVIEKHPKAKLQYYRNNTDTFNIVFCGTYVPLQGIQIIIDAMEILKQKYENIYLYLWGNKDTVRDSTKWQNQVKERKLDDCIYFLNEWDKDGYYKWCVENCSLMLGVFGESKKAYTVVPNKVVDALAFGIPLITGESEGCSEFFNGKTDVILVPHKAADLADAIENIMNSDLEEVESRVKKTDDIYLKNFSESVFLDKFKTLFAEFEKIK